MAVTTARPAAVPTLDEVPAAPSGRHPYARFARACTRVLPAKVRGDMERDAAAKASEGFLKALRFSRLDVTPFEVQAAALTGFLIGLVMGVVGGAVVATFAGAADMTFILYAGAGGAALGFGALFFLDKFPHMHASALRTRTAGQMPEAVSYLALSMQLNPSLTKAVEFAAGHSQEPIAGSLRNVLWRVYVRDHSRVEDAFNDFALEWGDWSEDFKKALFSVRAAELEATPEGREAALDKATTSMFRGARALIEDFAMSLSGPSTMFFATGIILPMMIGSMLPLMSMGGGGTPPVFIVLLFDVVFPAFTFLYAFFILQRRPATSALPRISTRLTAREKQTAALGTCLAAAIPFGVGVLALREPALAFLGYLPFLWAFSLPLAVYAYTTTKRLKAERDRVRQLEQEYPDALYQMGSRMGEGQPIEKAMESAAGTLEGTEIAVLFRKATYRLKVMKTSLEDTLFGSDGVLARQPSRVVGSTMKVVVGAARKEARTAARTVINVSAYLREMITVEREIRNRLKDVTDTMLTTGTFFAPVVLGVTVALNLIITDTLGTIDLGGAGTAVGFEFSGSGGATTPTLSPSAFGLVVGIYLVLTVLVTTFFVNGIRNGADAIERKWMLGNSLPVALIVYSVAIVLVQFTLG